MNLTVWKFPVAIEDAFALDMPEGARVLSVQVQGDKPWIWALVDPKAPKVRRTFVLMGTGHKRPAAMFRAGSLEASLEFVGTFQLSGGALVFHLWVEQA